MPAQASSGQFIGKTSTHSFSATVASLKKAIASNGMMVLGNLNQGGALSVTGLNLQAQSFMVGNPTVGKQLFQMDPAVGAVIPCVPTCGPARTARRTSAISSRLRS